jgi:hypothetical protein
MAHKKKLSGYHTWLKEQHGKHTGGVEQSLFTGGKEDEWRGDFIFGLEASLSCLRFAKTRNDWLPP